MSKRGPFLLIEDILESADKILEYTKDISFEDFTKDSKTIDAVIRNFEIIGEAANRLPDDFKSRHTNIDWHRIGDFETGSFIIILALTILSFGKLKSRFCQTLFQH